MTGSTANIAVAITAKTGIMRREAITITGRPVRIMAHVDKETMATGKEAIIIVGTTPGAITEQTAPIIVVGTTIASIIEIGRVETKPL